MSDQTTASSLLDGLILGEPISDHHGVRCCPAIQEDSDHRYIIKIISLPATPSHLDALMLTGAYANEDQALNYFRELAHGITQEADLLRRLSKLDGFVSYPSFETRKMPRGIGYQVFLQSPYRPSLAKLMQDDPLNHLAAVNMAIDLCAALAACRRMGYLHVDVRPENIFYCEDQGYRIGDLGFISMASLRYASLPQRYRSIYTAPEVSDALSSLSDTMDIYALGLTLYQVFNNGQLPFEDAAPAKALPSPLYADYEMAAIILKACAPDPKDRWADPVQMGQALMDYMHRNQVKATPLIPAPVLNDTTDPEEDSFLTEEENDEQLAQLLAQLPEELPPEQLAMDGSSQPLTELASTEENSEFADETEESDTDQLTFLSRLCDDETAPSDEDIHPLDEEEVTGELADFFAQIDDLISHELPQPVVAPAPIDIPVPPPVTEEPEEEEEPEALTPIPCEEIPTEEDHEDVPEDSNEPTYDTEDAVIYDRAPRGRSRRGLAAIIVFFLLLAAGIGGYFWYQNCFLVKIDALTIQGSGSELKVTVVTNADEKLLSVVCTDTYGNSMTAPVQGGTADFANLTPGAQYRIRVQVSGLHKATGNTTGLYTTQEQTQILNFIGICGPEDGSVILSFSLDGPDCAHWSVEYSTPGEAPRKEEFDGHSVTITGLIPGCEYTFTLEGDGTIPLAGETQLLFTAQEILYAENLQITECGNGSMTVKWNTNASSDQVWHLRCYNDQGYDRAVSTTDLSYTFNGLDHSTGYTVLVTADGMTQSTSVSVTANPIRLTGYTATETAPYALTLTWEFTGNAPAGGWILSYRVNGGSDILIPCESNQTKLALVPGATYEYTVQPAQAITFFPQDGSYVAPEATTFEGFSLKADDLSVGTVLLPQEEEWTYDDLLAEGYITEFTQEDTVSILLSSTKEPQLTENNVTILFALRDEAAQLINAEQLTVNCLDLWDGSNCLLTLPDIPQIPGSYIVDLYINDMLVSSLTISLI